MATKRARLTIDEYESYKRTGVIPESYKTRLAEKLEREAVRKQRKKEVNRVHHRRCEKVRREKYRKEPYTYWGLDGEGITKGGRHLYNMIVAAPMDPSVPAKVLSKHSLDTFSVLMWLTEGLPGKARYVTFSFGYDLTKILEDLDPLSIYKLFRPELRRGVTESGEQYFYPVVYPGFNQAFTVDDYRVWFKLDWLNGKFTVTRFTQNVNADPQSKPEKRGPFIIFDIFKFFGKAFVGAIADWKVPRHLSVEDRDKLHKFISDMKATRGVFNEADKALISEYCKVECRLLAELATLLIETHAEAGIPLNPNALYGAGSSGKAMLKALGVGGTKKNPGYCQKAQQTILTYPPELYHAIMCAFAGGRFEHNVLGVIKGPIASGDISSAYPYQCCFLPDLVGGNPRWELTRNRNDIENCQAAVVHYKLHKPRVKKAWAPFPYRIPKGPERGSITYPEYGSEGWVWRDEYISGERGWDNVEFIEAWVFKTDSDYLPLANMAKFYAERLARGKEGVGIAIKLGLNSGGYGIFAQTLGGELGQYTNWVYSGMITSGCRSQMLDVMNIHSDLNNLLMIATDGYNSREDLSGKLPIPKDTGTFDCVNDKGLPANKPLGGWEHKMIEKDVAYIRPGIYFPLDPTAEEVDKMRARGIGRKNLANNWERILQDLKMQGVEGQSVIGEVSVFHGAKTSVYRLPSKIDSGRLHATVSPLYGTWTSEPRILKFDPAPKRAGLNQDGESLMLRVIKNGLESAPYSKGVSKFAKELMAYQSIVEEQPDYEFLDDMFDTFECIQE